MAVPSTSDLLKAREIRGLRDSIRLRLAVATIAMVYPIVLPQHSIERWASVGTLAVLWGVAVPALRMLGRGQNVSLVGTLTSGVDIAMLIALPMTWYNAVGGAEVPTGYLFKTKLPAVATLVMAVSALSLRPRYPLLVSGGFVLIQLYFVVLVLDDPRTVYSDSLVDVFMGPAVSLPFHITMNVAFTALVGIAITVLTLVARRTVLEGIELERANVDIKETQAQVILEEKVGALADLVAGIAHEVNSPLGAVSSSAQTAGLSAQKVRELIDSATDLDDLKRNKKLRRVLSIMENNSTVIAEAGGRISGVVDTLKKFTRLDESRVQTVDIREGIEAAVDLIGHRLQSGVEIQQSLSEVPKVQCEPERINQVFRTILINAVEAVRGRGQVLVACEQRGEFVVVRVQDDGVGIPADNLPSLFEIKFSSEVGPRVRAALGLPIAQTIVHRHGGTILVESTEGQGTTFEILIPVNPASQPELHAPIAPLPKAERS